MAHKVTFPVLLAAGLLAAFAVPAAAQWRYADDKGVSKTSQYKLDIPSRYRDTAEWIGPTGIGKPHLSDGQQELKARDDAYRRIGKSEAGLIKLGKPAEDRPFVGAAPGPSQPLAAQCIANTLKIMTSPGVWKSGGPCYSGPTTDIPTIR